MENELPESFKIVIPVLKACEVTDKLQSLGYEQIGSICGNSFIFCGSDLTYYFGESTKGFVNCSDPEITITQLMNAKQKVNEIEEGFDELSNLLERSISTLKNLRDKIDEKS